MVHGDPRWPNLLRVQRRSQRVREQPALQSLYPVPDALASDAGAVLVAAAASVIPHPPAPPSQEAAAAAAPAAAAADEEEQEENTPGRLMWVDFLVQPEGRLFKAAVRTDAELFLESLLRAARGDNGGAAAAALLQALATGEACARLVSAYVASVLNKQAPPAIG